MGKTFDVQFMLSTVPEIIKFLPITLFLSITSFAIGVVIGSGVALIRYFDIKIASKLCKVYISFIRGTPALVQLLLVYYGLPIFLNAINSRFGTNISVNAVPRLVFAVIALSLNSGAYMSEIIRSALLSVDKGQMEACHSVNMSTWTALRRVILPQTFVVALPPLGNNFISMLKETSLVFSISVVDIMAQAKITSSRSFRFFETYIVVSIIYWCCCILIEQVLTKIELRLNKF
ncbi:MAG: amino acid ABC transporter permease [Synergistaceae bacterium]|jgi:L-cystine transport system permease protein|nr:amino acid ABC transporter permease [Synergistaceae bacterium]